MSEPNAPEPTMEEILASIRRIISEDDAPAAASAEAPAAAAHEEPHEEATALMTDARAAHDDVLELTDRVEPTPPAPAPAFEPTPTPVAAPPSQSLGDLDFAPAAAPEPAPTVTPAPEPEPAPAYAAPRAAARSEDDSSILSGHTADLAANHFGALTSSIAMPAAGRSLEDLVREMMRPMLKAWLDENLAGIVESRVQAEVERISRTRR